jgi:uncharacterized protein (TIGR00375 family)
MTIPQLAVGARQKGLHLIGTGDATQPDWFRHLEKTLKVKDDLLLYESIHFVPTVEFEDGESIHHVVLLPNLESVRTLRRDLKEFSPNMDHEWGGRPRVNLQAEVLAGFVRDNGGMIGPAHAFTPFRAIFREGKYDSLQDCYGKETPHIHFIELGLSADSEVADCIPELRFLTYITSSDAHSPYPDKLGREFVSFEMESPSFEELRLAILREKGRRPLLNVGFDPRLGKYFLSFCSSCRRTLVLRDGDDGPEFDDMNIYMYVKGVEEKQRLLQDIHCRKVFCPADGKKLRLGVRDRAMMIGEGRSKAPSHRPPYLHVPPLLELMSTALGIKSKSSKRITELYRNLREQFGPEVTILSETPVAEIAAIQEKLAQMLAAYRKGNVEYIPGGGGRYGTIATPWEADER